MNLQLLIAPEAEARLREQAAAAGKDVETYVLDAVCEKLADAQPPSSKRLRGAEWRQEFHALLTTLPQVAHFVDDSRQAIYEGRGE